MTKLKIVLKLFAITCWSRLFEEYILLFEEYRVRVASRVACHSTRLVFLVKMLRVDAIVALTISQSFSNMQNDQIVELNEWIKMRQQWIKFAECALSYLSAKFESHQKYWAWCKTRILTWHTLSNSNRVCNNNCNCWIVYDVWQHCQKIKL